MKNIPRFKSCDLLNQHNILEDCIVFDLQRVISLRNNMVSEAHSHSFYQVLFITAGTGVHYIEQTEYHIEKGDVFFLSPGQVHKWHFNESTQGFLVNFSPDFFRSFLANPHYLDNIALFSLTSQNNLIKAKQYYNTMLNIFDKIAYQGQLLTICDYDLIRIYLLEVFLLCEKKIEKKDFYNVSAAQASNLTKQFDQLIEIHFQELRFPKQYANLLHVTPNYLNAICQKVKDQSAGEIIRNRILLESKRLLLNTNLSASEIAYKLNFKDNSYFSRFFKKYVGSSPDEYRKS